MGKNDRCCVYNCGHNRDDGAKCSFYSIPRNPHILFKRYQSLLKYNVVLSNGRKVPWKPSVNSKICSCHWPVGHSPDPKSRTSNKMSNLPSIKLPNKGPVKSRSTWKCRNRRNVNDENKLASNRTSESVVVNKCKPCTLTNVSSQNSLPSPDSSSIAAVRDHDYLHTNSDINTENFVENLRKQEPDFYHHYLNVVEKAEAYDKAVENLSLLTLDSIKHDDSLIRYYTGFSNYNTFRALYIYLEPKAKNLQYCYCEKRRLSGNFKDKGYFNKPGASRQTTLENELFMTLYRMRLGVPTEECAYRFGLKCSTFNSIFNTWVVFIALELESLCKINSYNARIQTRAACFQDFCDVVIVLDCTELFTETPSSLKAHKHHNTVKFLVGMSTFGAITYISSMHGGIASDKFITRTSDDLLNILRRGDAVMGDRAYTIQEDLPSGVKVITPCMKSIKQTQFTQKQVLSSQKISKARVHVERAIGRIKSFGLLEREVKISSIKQFEYVFKACAYLVNFQSPFLTLSEE